MQALPDDGIDADEARLLQRLVAEGIETTNELATLKQLGIPFGRGFYLGHPVVGGKLTANSDRRKALRSPNHVCTHR